MPCGKRLDAGEPAARERRRPEGLLECDVRARGAPTTGGSPDLAADGGWQLTRAGQCAALCGFLDLRRGIMKEEAVQFGEAGSLIGIVATSPHAKAKNSAVILLNPRIVPPGWPGRIYVKNAPALAGRGFSVLRFYFFGIGDSTVRLDNL